jgi:hypothetical protein
MANDANNYLQYLDKEMTIMGILSTFCVAVVALVLDRVGSAEPSKQTFFYFLWKNQSFYIVLGSSCIALAAALFYQQRSALAWFYGQISLSIKVQQSTGSIQKRGTRMPTRGRPGFPIKVPLLLWRSVAGYIYTR